MVGDVGVGKTSLVMTYTSEAWSTYYTFPYAPNFERYGGNLLVDGTVVNLSILDTADTEEFDRLRVKEYPDTDVFLCLFSVAHPPSFENVSARWHPELSHHCPGVPILLVGSKVDLREADPEVPHPPDLISFEQGEDMMRAIGATKYMECSSLKQKGLSALFQEAIRAVLHKEKKKGGGCVFI
uniref:Uncharacterized protein n=1 Tax=Arcella intermedia TaxID=1963864 RepID=A0A6B2LK58_9EUKA